MSIETVWISSDYILEGLLNLRSRKKGAVLCHPHPLYGGSMDNNVIYSMEKGFSSAGFTTLRFNFRGVGRSEGSYGGGDGEIRDLISALGFLESRLDFCPRVVLAGYSFGAWICAKVAALRREVSDLFLVSYPFAFFDQKEVTNFKKRIYFVCGSKDQISPLDCNMRVYRELPQIEKSIMVVNTDHFYFGLEAEIEDFIERAFS